MLLTILYSVSAYPITLVEPLKPRFWYNSKICLLFSRKQIIQFDYHMLFTISYSESAYPITPVDPLKAILYDYFGISIYFVGTLYSYKQQ